MPANHTSESFVPTELWNVIHNEVLAQCDGIDGAVDGKYRGREIDGCRREKADF